ncbi:AMP-binding enzyme family protein [Mycobacterium ulcerans str. Harvey]|uniref:AMP-binding enzyme family protein n=1 Tax=Mycobacterium ulcerans str. Harvey TaxID=1299332 RepID=A0ABN0R9N9_MYCUL|nr:AMP-binding enzyme family protein [Mycobacterium ulcerans str. Harvey]
MLTNRCASVLRALGVGKGDRVALLMPNSVAFCCLFCGAAKLGAVAVPLKPAWPTRTGIHPCRQRQHRPDLSPVIGAGGHRDQTATSGPQRHRWVPLRTARLPGATPRNRRCRRAVATAAVGHLFIMYTSAPPETQRGVHTHDSVHTAASSCH